MDKYLLPRFRQLISLTQKEKDRRDDIGTDGRWTCSLYVYVWPNNNRDYYTIIQTLLVLVEKAKLTSEYRKLLGWLGDAKLINFNFN